MDVYGHLPNSYTPIVGNVVSATGVCAPYSWIPEMGGTAQNDISAISTVGTASVPAPLNPSGMVLGQSYSGIQYLIQDTNQNKIPGTNPGHWCRDGHKLFAQ